jgi:long-chain fatty acid transport protein
MRHVKTWRSLIATAAWLASITGHSDGIVGGFSSIGFGRWPGTNLSPAVIVLNPAWGNTFDHALSIQFGFNRSQTVMRPKQPSSYQAFTINPYDLKASAFGVTTIGTKVVLGLGIYSPLGMEGQWADDWLGRYLVRQFRFQPWVAQPTFGYKLSDMVSAGVSAVIPFSRITYNRAVNLQNQSLADGSMSLSGHGLGFGGKAGVFVDFGPLATGVSATLPLAMTMTGNAEFVVPSSLSDSFPSTTFSVPISTAASLGLQVCFEKGDVGLLSAGVDFSLPRVSDSSRIDFASNSSLLPDEYLYLNRKSELSVWAGVCALSLSPKWQASVGAFYATGTALADHLVPHYPDSGKAGLVAGISRPLFKQTTFCLNVNYMETAATSGVSKQHGFEASYKSRTWGVQLGLIWK